MMRRMWIVAIALFLWSLPVWAAPWCEYTTETVGDAEVAEDLRERQLAWYLVSFADVLSTDIAINHRGGFEEANPFVNSIIGKRPSSAELWAYGALTAWGADMALCKWGGTWEQRKQSFEVLVVTRGVVVIWNIGQF